MIQHNFISHTTRQLIDLRGDLLGTLKNHKCEILSTPISETIKQINSELELRGIKSLLKSKQ